MDPIWYMHENASSHLEDYLFADNLTRFREQISYTTPSLEALDFYPWQILLIVIYSTTAFISLGSNVLTIVILLRGEHVSTELWKFLLNLSISDITMAIFCIPFTYTNYMLGRWIFPHFLCPIITFVQITSVSVSIWTLTAIGVDRYFAILYPFRPLVWLKQHKVTAIGSIWLLGFAIAFPQLLYSSIKKFKYQNNEYYDCRETFSDFGGKAYTIFLFLFTFFIPIVALIFFYSQICYHLWHNTSAPGNPDQNRDKVCITKKMKVIKMLLTIVILFALCWLPIHLFQLLVWFHPSMQNRKTKLGYYTYVGCYFLFHWMAMAHSLVNPFVYCFMSDNFRSLRNTLSKCFTQLKRYESGEEQQREHTQLTVHSMSGFPPNHANRDVQSTQIIRINSKSSLQPGGGVPGEPVGEGPANADQFV